MEAIAIEPKDFFPHLGKEIRFDDTRSQAMPNYNKIGLVVGIRLNSVELRTNNVVTQWYPLNSARVVFYLSAMDETENFNDAADEYDASQV